MKTIRITQGAIVDVYTCNDIKTVKEGSHFILESPVTLNGEIVVNKRYNFPNSLEINGLGIQAKSIGVSVIGTDVELRISS